MGWVKIQPVNKSTFEIIVNYVKIELPADEKQT